MTPTESFADTAQVDRPPPAIELPGLLPGASVGRYLVVDRVGEGGMGVVYKAYDPQLGRTVALKLVRTVHEGRLDTGGTLRERFLREARALALLSHPNVINVHDAGVFGDDVFIAMEFVEGPTLGRWLRAEPRSRDRILDVFLAAGAGLVAAHTAGLVHRDFKPDNVIVSPDGRVRVLDFGLARAVDVDDDNSTLADAPHSRRQGEATPKNAESTKAAPSSSRTGSGGKRTPAGSLSSLTEGGAIMGTPRFMAPEQHLGHSVDERADQFSFCVALYTALYGAAPFAGTSIAELTDNVIIGNVAEPPAGSKVPRWLRTVLLRGLSVEPAARYPSMSALLAALRADSTIARGRWIRTGLVAAVVASAGLAWFGSHRNQTLACQGASRALAGVWDDGRRGSVRSAFLATQLPYAESVLHSVNQAFDEYADAWTKMRIDACEATNVRGEQSQELLDLRMTCLDDRLAEMKALGDVFTNADPKVVEHAVTAAEALPLLAPCADTVALRDPVPPPRDPAAAKRVGELREQLAQVEARWVAGGTSRNAEGASEALAAAEELHYAPLEAEAAYVLGNLLGDQGDFTGAGRSYHHALVAATSGRHDAVAAKAIIALVHADGAMHSRFEDADRWADLAEASIGRFKQKDELLGSLYEERSILRRRESKLGDALEDAKRALDLRLKVYGPRNDHVAITYHFLGNAYWALAKYPEALDAYGHATDIIVAEVGPDHPKLAATLIGMGNVHGDMGDHDRAVSDYQRALAILEKVAPNDPDIGGVYNNMGDELQSVGKLAEARAQYLRALEWRNKTLGPSFEMTMVLDNLGEVSLDLNDDAAAMTYFRRARDMGEQVLGREHALFAGSLWGIGEVYRREGKLDLAWDAFQKSLPIAEKALGPDHPMLAKPLLLGIGLVQLARHERASAVATLERAVKLEEEAARPSDLAAVKAALAEATRGDTRLAKAPSTGGTRD